MKLNYQFSHLLGTLYHDGHLAFANSGNHLYSPVGNRVTVFDIKCGETCTIAVNSSYNIVHLCLSPTTYLMIAIDEQGRGYLCSIQTHAVINSIYFGRPIDAACFSPDGRWFVISKHDIIDIYHAPQAVRSYNQLLQYRRFSGAHDAITYFDWSSDSRLFIAGSADHGSHVYPVRRCVNMGSRLLGGHSDVIIGCFFELSSLNVYSISRNGQVAYFKADAELEDLRGLREHKESQVEREAAMGSKQEAMEMGDDESDSDDSNNDEAWQDSASLKKHKPMVPVIRYIKARKYWYQVINNSEMAQLSSDGINNRYKSQVTCVAYHKKLRLLVSGFEDGICMLHLMPDFQFIYSINNCQHPITSIVLNPSGSWIAMAASVPGQISVLEWQTEQFVMPKQESHPYSMTCLAYSPLGDVIATGSSDNKVKLWSVHGGLCVATLDAHVNRVTGLVYPKMSPKMLLSASLDGTVRAYHIIGTGNAEVDLRCRNFRTFTSNTTDTQFTCLTCDPLGQLVAASGTSAQEDGSFPIYIWSVARGTESMDKLVGHDAPVSSLAFSPINLGLTSAGWDGSLRIWDIKERRTVVEVLQLFSDVLSVIYRPDGLELAASTLNGQLHFVDVNSGQVKFVIEGRKDLGYGHKLGSKISDKKANATASFNALCYSSDGLQLIAGGSSKFICLYSVLEQHLLKKFEITCNLSLDAVLHADIYDVRRMAEFTGKVLSGIERKVAKQQGGIRKQQDMRLPGVRPGEENSGGRSFRPEVKVFDLKFSPTGESFAVACTEGLLLYSLDRGYTFSPENLNLSITPATVKAQYAQGLHTQALCGALSLRDDELCSLIVMNTTQQRNTIFHMCSKIPEHLHINLCRYLVKQLQTSNNLHLVLLWTKLFLNSLSPMTLKRSDLSWQAALCHVRRGLSKSLHLQKIMSSNHDEFNFLQCQAKLRHGGENNSKIQCDALFSVPDSLNNSDQVDVVMTSNNDIDSLQDLLI